MFKFLKKIFGKKSKVQEEVKETTVVSDCEGCTCDCDVCCSEEVVSEVEQPKEEVVEVTEKLEEVSKTEETTSDIKYYTVSEACKVLGKSDRTVRRMLTEGKLSGEKIDGKWRITL